MTIQSGNAFPARMISVTPVAAPMSRIDALQRWIAGLSDGALLQSFERALAEDETPLMWRIADEIEQRRLAI